jgi:hypothetical protein
MNAPEHAVISSQNLTGQAAVGRLLAVHADHEAQVQASVASVNDRRRPPARRERARFDARRRSPGVCDAALQQAW